jgi:hypothetical protein
MRRAATLAALLAAALTLSAASLAPSAAARVEACGAGAHGSPGYGYAGHQAQRVARGVRATISALRAPRVGAGHVAGWVGVGGPGQGPNGTTMWVQAGLAAVSALGLVAYAEVTRPGQDPQFTILREKVAVGERVTLAVLETADRPDHWRIWIDGLPVGDAVHLRAAGHRWKPIVTAESFDGGAGACNDFAFRFERVGVAAARGGSWSAFVPGYRFLDQGYHLRQLRPSPNGQRTLATDPVKPYAFEAASG